MKYFRSLSRQRRRQVVFDTILSLVLIASTAVFAPMLWDWLPRTLAGEEALETVAENEPPDALGFVTTTSAPPATGDPATKLPAAEPEVDETEPEIALNRRLAPDRVLRLREDTPSTFELGIVAGRPAPVEIVVEPTMGSVTRRGNGEWSYTPDPNVNGLDEFLYRVCLDGECEDGFVLLTIAGLNDPPIAAPDHVDVAAGRTVVFDPAVNDLDPDVIEGDLAVAAVGVPLQGTTVLHPDGTIEYRAPGVVGEDTTDSFTYVICDPPGGCSTATVTVTLSP